MAEEVVEVDGRMELKEDEAVEGDDEDVVDNNTDDDDGTPEDEDEDGSMEMVDDGTELLGLTLTDEIILELRVEDGCFPSQLSDSEGMARNKPVCLKIELLSCLSEKKM
jgi:hypothetical protein